MKRLRQLLAIFMTITMLFTGTSLSDFSMFSFAAEDEDNVVVSQEMQEDSNDAEAEGPADTTEPTEATEPEETTQAEPADEESDLVYKTLKANKVKLDGMMPEDAKLAATDASAKKAVKGLDTGDGTTLAAYDITIRADGEEYQPDADHPITVEISDKAIKEDSDLAIWHIHDDGTEEQIEDFGVENGKVIFDATGFSVYVIVEGPEAPKTKVHSLDELAGNPVTTEYWLSYNGANGVTYVTNTWESTQHVYQITTEVDSASGWFFERVGDANNKYYIYTINDGVKKYMYAPNPGGSQTNSNYMDLRVQGSGYRTVFEVQETENPPNGKFYLKVENYNKWLQYSKSGSGIRLYGDNNNPDNSQFTINYAISPDIPNDPYNLEGKSYGIINHRGGTSAAALLAEQMQNNAHNLKALDVQVRVDPIKKDSGNLVIAKGSNISFWTFRNESEDVYRLETEDGKYLRIEDSDATITDTLDNYCKFRVIPCDEDDAGKIRIVNCDNYELNIKDGKASNGFYGRNNYSGADSRMTLISPSDVYVDNDFVEYTAKKVSVSNIDHVCNGKTVVVYTRIWNEDTKKYDFYAIDHEGELVYCYETGDHIRWTGARVNTMLWQFTEYYYEGTKNPNYYYELQNTYSGKYIAPKISGGIQILSDSTIGINLEGRRNNEYGSTIVAWDDPQYDYAGLKIKENSLELTADLMADAGTFYFAYMEESQGTLTPINTVDHHKAVGLTMKMANYDGSNTHPTSSSSESITSMEQWQVIGEQTYTKDHTNPGLLSSDIKEDGYPVAAKTENHYSLKRLFDGHQSIKTVNHLFLKETYEESGYFVYDSSQNFAHRAQNDENFTVYKELGTTNIENHDDTLAHGQFMPYNDLDVPNVADKHPENLTDITAKDLPDDNPRKGETLYKYTEDPDHFFGMEINGNMMQTPSGKDKWGHDIIFEFTGDDDFWLYVDGLLVLDLGGIHKALSGSINYSTGEVIVNGKKTSLRAMFKASYENSHPEATSADVNAFLNKTFKKKGNNYVFKDYSLHSIKIFFMERGAGASNLRMRFNLSPVEPGHVLLSKQLSGTNQDKYAGVEFPYQIFYRLDGETSYTRAGGTGDETTVKYQGTEQDIEPVPRKIINGFEYENVYYLKPNEVADIDFPNETIDYYIVECGVDTTIYNQVEINGGTDADPDNEPTPTRHSDTIYDYGTKPAAINDRAKVIFTNHVNPASLRTINVKKELVDQNGNLITNDTTGFRFRMYLKPTPDNAGSGSSGTQFTEQDYYRLSPYYVKNSNGYYCRYDSEREQFVSLGKTNFDDLDDTEKKQAKFTTSPSGAIDKIPTGYSFEIRDVLIGTSYNVEEKSYDLPKGYTFKKFKSNKDPNRDDITAASPNNIEVEAINEKGLGLTANKIWSDADSTDYHEDIYLAVYDGDQLLMVNRPDLGINNQTYIKRIKTKTDQNQTVPDKSAYFFIPAVSGKNLNNYSVKEVELEDGTVNVDENGFVTNYTGSVTPIDNNGVTRIKAFPGEDDGYNYTVTYEIGSVPEGKNTRTDTVTNTRAGGIQLIKEDLNGNKLADASFTLEQAGENVNKTFTSDSNGVITTMYDYKKNVDYTLTEVEAPSGYTGLPSAITIRVENDGHVNVDKGSVPEELVVVVDSGSTIPTITIKNRKSKFIVNKVDQVNRPLAGARFCLSRQIKDSKTGEDRKDYYPLANFEELPTSTGTTDDGVIMTAAKTETLEAGSYYLTETQTPEGYTGLEGDLLFNISKLGVVTVTTEAYSSYLTTSGRGTIDNPIVYELNVQNHSTGQVAPTGYIARVLPFLLILIGGLLLGGLLVYARRRRNSEE